MGTRKGSKKTRLTSLQKVLLVNGGIYHPYRRTVRRRRLQGAARRLEA